MRQAEDESRRRRGARFGGVALAAALVLGYTLAGCGQADQPIRLSGSPAVDAAAPDIRVRIPYSLQGVPGPWWRDNAMHEDFETDQRACRKISSAERAAASSDDRNDVAYRAFLDCMTDRAWTRGVPPPQSEAS